MVCDARASPEPTELRNQIRRVSSQNSFDAIQDQRGCKLRTTDSSVAAKPISSTSLNIMRGRSSSSIPFSAFPLLFAALCCFPTASFSQQPAAPAPSQTATTANSRPCSANPVLAPSAKSKSAKKSKHPLPVEPLPVCIEVKGQPIEIQEFLQSTAREFQWRIDENHASEDTWSFVRYLNDEELAKYGDTKVLVQPVQFAGGKVALTIRTTELNDNYARAQIIVHIQGEGKSLDKLSAQPVVWTLRSTGVLEQELISALQSRYKPTE